MTDEQKQAHAEYLARRGKTMSISKLIEALQAIQADVGDLPIVMSRDSEGNGYGTFSPDFDTDNLCGVHGGIIALYPHADHLEIDEVHGYKFEEEDDE